MGPKRLSLASGSGSGEKRKKEMLSLDVKQEIIEKPESGVPVSELAKQYGRNMSTISIILKEKEAIEAEEGSGGNAGESSTEPSSDNFKAFRDWFKKFKKQSGIHSAVRHREAASADTKAVADFVKNFERIRLKEGYAEQQMFNCDETGLFGKRCPVEPTSLPKRNDIFDEFKFIKALYIPPNTTSILQPMDQQVILNFKKFYTKHLFKECFNVTQRINLTLREFWKSHFKIVQCLKIIDQAWVGLTRRTLNSA
ncbi:tigger transposable element-derived protein 1-like [Palaemon carinicauda]|uniref:tigger transposable element-derived protein 1-like n=1 Tax=Palaemon carinicauda TaxID=392227 RepID=UPI0035B67A74